VLWNAGASLIRGFINGIRSMIGSVRSTLGSITSHLPSWKGPESLDKRILTPSGRWVLQGFQEGIAAQVPALRRQLQGLTAQLPDMTSQVTQQAAPAGVSRAAGAAQDRGLRIELAGPEDMKRLIRRIVQTNGRGGDPASVFATQ
jgi:hypothetical protein